MYRNSTSFVAAPNPAQADPVLPLRARLPLDPLPSDGVSMPLMRSKEPARASVPRGPDIAAMRERREASQISVRTLQRLRSIEPVATGVANRHGAMRDAYGYGQIAEWLMAVPRAGMDLLHGFANGLQQLRLGPLACDAAATKDEGLSVNGLRQRFSRDFEIWPTPSARNAASMKGMVVVVGENHQDPDIQQLVRELMLSFRPARGTRLFMEGNGKNRCAVRAALYRMAPGDCQLLEANSPLFASIDAAMDEVTRFLDSSLDQLLRYRPSLRASAPNRNLNRHLDVINFIEAYLADLPLSAVAEMAALSREVRAALSRAHDLHLTLIHARDAQMSARVRSAKTGDGVNIMIVGAAHLPGLGKRLDDLPCIFMLPKALVASDPSLSLKRKMKEEL